MQNPISPTLDALFFKWTTAPRTRSSTAALKSRDDTAALAAASS